MQLTDRINRIQISPTAAVISEAEKLKARGVDIADFGPGEPDFPTPEHIKKAAIKAIEENKSKYTPAGGIMPLREAICAWHKRELGSSYEAKECVVSVGGKHSIFNVMSVLIQHGDEVIIPAPYWVSFPDIVKYAGGTPVFVETRPEDGFAVRDTAIEKAITPRTKLLILNSPSNPTGGVVPPDEYERILALCRKHKVWLMGDECYSHFTYEPHKPYSVASAAGSKENVIIIGSVSKTFAMTGWRIGYTLGPEALIQALIKLQSQSTSNATSISQYAALEAMRGTMETVPIMLAEYAKRRIRIVEGLRAMRMAGRGVLRLPEYFGAPDELSWQTGAGKNVHGNLQNVARQSACRGRAGRSLWGARLSAPLLRHFHRTHRGRTAPPRTFFLAR